MVGRRTSSASGTRSGTYFDVDGERGETVLVLARDAGRRVVPGGRGLTTPSTSSATRTRTRSRSATPPSCATLGELDLGRAARADRAHPRRPARARRRPGRPRRRLPAEHPRDDRRLPRLRLARRVWSSAAPEFGARSVVDRFAQIEPKVLLAIDGYRYGGKDFDRSRRRRRDRRRDPRRSSASSGSATSTARGWERRLPRPTRQRRRSSSSSVALRRTRSGSSTRSGTTGLPKAIVHGAGRDPARAPEEDAPAPRRAGPTTASSGSRRPAG